MSEKNERADSAIYLRFSGDASREAEAVILEDVEHLGDGPEGAHRAEHRQQDVPHDQVAAELEAVSVLHVTLAGEDEEHVHGRPDDAVPPVDAHPSCVILHLELLLEVEGVAVRVVGRRVVDAVLLARRDCQVVNDSLIIFREGEDSPVSPSELMRGLHREVGVHYLLLIKHARRALQLRPHNTSLCFSSLC